MYRKQSIPTRIISFCIALITVVSCVLIVPMDAYAKKKTYYSWDEVFQDAGTSIMYLASQLGCVLRDGDFVQYIQNQESWNNYWNEDNLKFDVDSQSYVASDDFMKWLKEMLQQYADENEPYRIMSSAALSSIPYSDFNYQKNVYDTIKNLMSDSSYGKGMTFSTLNLGYTTDGKRKTQVIMSYYPNPSDISYVSMGYQGGKIVYHSAYGYSWSEWSSQVYHVKTSGIVLVEDDNAIESVAEMESIAQSNKGTANYVYVNYPDSVDKYKNTNVYSRVGFFEVDAARYTLSGGNVKVTPTTEHHRVYSTVDDFIDYTLNRRKIYYTSDWYNKEPGAVTVDLSEMQDTLDDIESALQKLIEQIKNDTSEDDIEKLLQEILDELRNGGGGSGGGTGGGESGGGGGIEYDDSSLLSLLSGYFEEILMYLETITQLEYIQTVTDEKKDEFKNDMDEFLNESTSAFSEIGNAYSQKFPFCLPSDLSHLFGKLSGSSSTDTKVQSVYQINDIDTLHAVAKYGGGAFSGGEVSVMSDGTIPEESIQKPTLEASPLDAPHFKLPIKVASFGIEENIDVDLKDFQPISTFSRFMMSVLFVVGLLNLSIPLLHFINSVMD